MQKEVIIACDFENKESLNSFKKNFPLNSHYF